MTEKDGIRVFGPEDLERIPKRKADANKGTYGHVLVIAGSEGMCGAAYLSALAAYRTGAGLVRVLTPEPNRPILQILLPEAIVSTYDPEAVLAGGEEWKTCLEEALNWADVIVLGPGIGRKPWVKRLVEDVLEAAYVTLVVDADALNTIAEYPYLTGYYTENIIVTPHVAEMARLVGKTVQEVAGDLTKAACGYRDVHGVTCVLKSDRSVIAGNDGSITRTEAGTPALAKGGTGDVLTGIIAGLICLGLGEAEAAAFGSYLHALCGRRAAEKLSVHGVLAREVAEEIPGVMRLVPGISL